MSTAVALEEVVDVLPLPDGVANAHLTSSRLMFYWENLKDFNSMFMVDGELTFEKFCQMMIKDYMIFEIADEYDEVGGLVLLTDLRPKVRAEVHFSIWDRKLSKKTKTLKELMLWGFLYFNLQRIETFVPEYARAVKMFITKQLGFVFEGKLRNRTRYNGRPVSMLAYSILRDEVV